MQMPDLTKTEALAAARQYRPASIAAVNQLIGQREVVQAFRALTRCEVPAHRWRSQLRGAPWMIAWGVEVGVVGTLLTGIGFRLLGLLPSMFSYFVALGMTSLVSPGLVATAEKVSADEVKLLAGEGPGFIMGGTGNPTPVEPYLTDVKSLFLTPASPLFAGQKLFPATYQGLSTPEQFCPITACPPGGVSFGDSVNQGVAEMNTAIVPPLTHGDTVTTFGYSQSGTVATVELNNLLDNAGTTGFPTSAELGNLHSVIIADPNSPIAGILDRFQFPDIGVGHSAPGVHVPFLNIPLSLAPTPTSGIGDSVIYTDEYDGWADVPQDPVIGLLAEINSLIGIETVHQFYPDYKPDQMTSAVDIGTVGDTQIDFIPGQLPILQFMYLGSTTAGQFWGDLLQPWLKLIIDWSYGNAGDPGDNLTGTVGVNNAGGAGVDGMYTISPVQVGVGADLGGPNIAASPYEASVGFAGGPWADTPYGQLWQSTLPESPQFFGPDVASSGIAGIFEKMDPLQMGAGIENAAIQSIIGPWADVFAGTSTTLPAGEFDTVNDITQGLRFISGYDLANGFDQLLLDGLKGVGLQSTVNGLLDGPLIPGEPIIGVVGGIFDIFNLFGA